MKFYQLGFRYLQRKKGKTILLLIVLILVNSMIFRYKHDFKDYK